jgi:hypothetical protein
MGFTGLKGAAGHRLGRSMACTQHERVVPYVYQQKSWRSQPYEDGATPHPHSLNKSTQRRASTPKRREEVRVKTTGTRLGSARSYTKSWDGVIWDADIFAIGFMASPIARVPRPW